MTGAVGPIMATLHRPAKRLSHYKRRTIQRSKQNAEFRILTCFYDHRNVMGMINLLDCSNPTKESPLHVFALHLIELTGRASATLIAHNPNKPQHARDLHSAQIINTLETYANLNEHVNIQPLTALSPFPTMYEDICCLAEDKQICFTILPFHKLPADNGKLEEEGNISFRGVNVNALANAPCTVGIFVDRGFGVTTEGGSNLRMRHIAMLFFSGPDDREALEYAWRMSGGHGISLTVVRFIPGDRVDQEVKPLEDDLPANEGTKLKISSTHMERQRRVDDEYINEFRLKTAGEQHITYEEKVSNNDEETVVALKEMSHIFDLYVVGKGEGMISPLTAGLLDWCEYSELGPIGDLLVTSNFAQGSVLVVQKYAGAGDGGSLADLMATPDGSGRGAAAWRRQPGKDEDVDIEMAPFARQKEKTDMDV